MKYIIISILLFFSCCKYKNTFSQKRKIHLKNEKLTSSKDGVDLNDICNFDSILNSSLTPILAKELFKKNAKNNEKALEFFKKLKNSEKVEKIFYFKVLTNLYGIADGSTVEGLGGYGELYVEKNTLDFLNIFTECNCCSDVELKIWAKIVLIELQLKFENENDPDIVKNFINKLNDKCIDCNNTQKNTLLKFNIMIHEEWNNYLSNK
ncbi:MAG: hypothetical protein U0V72_14535 [Cytophagales bacterium]